MRGQADLTAPKFMPFPRKQLIDLSLARTLFRRTNNRRYATQKLVSPIGRADQRGWLRDQRKGEWGRGPMGGVRGVNVEFGIRVLSDRNKWNWKKYRRKTYQKKFAKKYLTFIFPQNSIKNLLKSERARPKNNDDEFSTRRAEKIYEKFATPRVLRFCSGCLPFSIG